MGCFFDCFRVKNVQKKGKISSNNQLVQKVREEKSSFKQVEKEKLQDYANNEVLNNEIKDEIIELKSVSKNQLSAVFLREDLEDENSINKIEDNKTLEMSSSDTPEKGYKQEETDIPIILERNNNPFIDKHILEEDQNPNSPITNPNSGTEVPSLSEWLKPVNKEKRYDFFANKSVSGDSERPIIGSVAAHWSEESELVSKPPVKKTWDGNGIPNSTNKYKEDQKVSWHATPFEERLEKALSEEKFLSKSGFSGGIHMELNSEGEESDTAAS